MTTRAAFPEDVKAPVQYGARIAAVVVYLLHHQLLPEDRLVQSMADLFGVKLAAGTIAAINAVARCVYAASPRRCAMPSPRRRSNAWTKPAFASAARRNGCTWPAPLCWSFMAPAPNAARCWPVSRASSSTIIGSHTIGWRAWCMRCATPIICANSRPWSTSRKKTGRSRCNVCCAAPAMSSIWRVGRGLTLDPRLTGLIERRYDAIVAQGLAFHEAQNPIARGENEGRRQATRPKTPPDRAQPPLAPPDPQTGHLLRFLHDPDIPILQQRG